MEMYIKKALCLVICLLVFLGCSSYGKQISEDWDTRKALFPYPGNLVHFLGIVSRGG
jgi:hypothetical protein